MEKKSLGASFQNFILGGISDDNKFYCANKLGIITFDSLDKPRKLKMISYHSTGFDSKPHFSKNYFAFAQRNSCNKIIIANIKTNSQCYTQGLYLSKVDTLNYKSMSLKNMDYFNSFSIIDDNNNNMIIPVETRTHDNIPESSLICLKLEDKGDGIFARNPRIVKFPNLPDFNKLVRHIKMANFKNKTFITYNSLYNNYPYLVTVENGEITSSVAFPMYHNTTAVYNLVPYNDMLLAHTGSSTLYYSLDGIKWTAIASLTPLIGNTCVIGDLLIASSNDTLFALKIDGQNIKMYELPNEDFKGSYITSLAYFEDKLLITSTTGIYYRDFNKINIDNYEIKPKGDSNNEKSNNYINFNAF